MFVLLQIADAFDRFLCSLDLPSGLALTLTDVERNNGYEGGAEDYRFAKLDPAGNELPH
ncbi:hypothetical protein [Agrobacterium tumefaciens]|uniref:hypothetical protein n=1 Tax=Agrobacterium tumefaciens TaxID=358 RepID=UPI001571BBEE|nr:hypothetical protein [Agrobacterium tumefaciens]WIE33970.1 hypothetical protein G6L82_014065 [Agrobacterium tumefaciens]